MPGPLGRWLGRLISRESTPQLLRGGSWPFPSHSACTALLSRPLPPLPPKGSGRLGHSPPGRNPSSAHPRRALSNITLLFQTHQGRWTPATEPQIPQLTSTPRPLGHLPNPPWQPGDLGSQLGAPGEREPGPPCQGLIMAEQKGTSGLQSGETEVPHSSRSWDSMSSICPKFFPGNHRGARARVRGSSLHTFRNQVQSLLCGDTGIFWKARPELLSHFPCQESHCTRTNSLPELLSPPASDSAVHLSGASD